MDGPQVDCFDYTDLRRVIQEIVRNEIDVHGTKYSEADAVDAVSSSIISTCSQWAPIIPYYVTLSIRKRLYEVTKLSKNYNLL